MKEKVIPIFLDWAGTTDKLLAEGETGEENLKMFFNATKSLQKASGARPIITIVSGGDVEETERNLRELNEISKEYGIENLFENAVAEYSGYRIGKDGNVTKLQEMPQVLADKTPVVKSILDQEETGRINEKINIYNNIIFPEDTQREKFDKILGLIQAECDDEFGFSISFSKDEKEIYMRHKSTNKEETVKLMMEEYNEKYEVDSVICGGDSLKVDVPMARGARNASDKKTYFIAPFNLDIPEQTPEIEGVEVVKSDSANSRSISDGINSISIMIEKSKDDMVI